MDDATEFIKGLVEISDEIKYLHQEHIDDHGELLLHLLMGDLHRYCLERLEKYGSEDQILTRLLNHLNDSFSGTDEYVDNAIALSFIDRMFAVEEDRELVAILPPALAAENLRQKNWRPMPDIYPLNSKPDPPPEPQRSRSGILHFLDGLRYSLKGYKAAWVHAEAFRQEIVVFIAAVVVAVFVGDSAVERALLIGILFPVLVAELINSAIETVVDRIGTEHNELSGRAKDLASAAVFTSIIAAVVVWLLVILG